MPRPPLTEFESKGWYLSEEGLALIEDEFDDDKGTQTVDDYIATALHMDLRQLSSKGFRKGDMQPVSTLPSPLVLQLLEVRNVAMPLAHQTDAPRLLRITFTDGGKKKWTGVEYFGAVDCIKFVF
ncbi:uncharacterized protein BYT42DRAFT_492763 [Radiomyces spectabilis]|uniref:uncharacterized protein n=1 Tax=Radiomyces spectabilis TaxID=64574 RepID=UPI00221F0852|nr:uncharacterized protein BYT42DRAFT_492763 [Radiomyces spectabilis]KAI8384336.1 hypothetical protein BYT42DRAFT_492763 [Radiomyces spectabilis]